MRIMMIGDVVGQAGVEHVRAVLPKFRRERQIDFVIANGENSAQGNGILPASADALFSAGCDVVTTGNHGLRRREIYEYLDTHPCLLRPANFHDSAPGSGFYIVDKPPLRLAVINLQGTVYMENNKNPFDVAQELLAKTPCPCSVVDFHAEATSEKLCMGHFLDGRVSLVVGTHTHVPTADERILPNGTGYITDVGMCGGLNSILGVKKELAISRFRTLLPTRFENDPNDIQLNAILAEVDSTLGKTTKIGRITI